MVKYQTRRLRYMLNLFGKEFASILESVVYRVDDYRLRSSSCPPVLLSISFEGEPLNRFGHITAATTDKEGVWRDCGRVVFHRVPRIAAASARVKKYFFSSDELLQI
jgi:hypothetical protein